MGIEAAASEAVGAASAEETVVDLEEATKWEEGGSFTEVMCFCNHQRVPSTSESTARAGFRD